MRGIPNWYNVSTMHGAISCSAPRSTPIRPTMHWPVWSACCRGRVTLVTQNIDNLHESAGSKNLIHMHGELPEARCRARVR